MVVPYSFISANLSFAQIELCTWWSWLLVLLCVDLGYYWSHRLGHLVNLFWAGHSPHHSSEEYNFSTALRQGVLESAYSWMFYLPLALFFSPSLFIVHKQMNTIFQFFVHTKCIDKLPAPIEFIFNTPSHHRVHHARNPKYIDKNFAGMLIIWDRIFGTFEPETETPVYGLVHPLASWNPVYAEFARLQSIVRKVRSAKGLYNKLSFVFRAPGWMPSVPTDGDGGQGRGGYFLPVPEVPHDDPQRVEREKYNRGAGIRPNTFLFWYILAQFVATALMHLMLARDVVAVVGFGNLRQLLLIVSCGGFVVFSLVMYGMMFEELDPQQQQQHQQ
eukprot:GEZU01032523.1.p1 GENE.GEZU01032523.1~~GEZU01032523.1.p1  ORF type:complete len:331 (-),score=81.04 GEZU01032523.1:86-1078(-)